MSDRSWLWFALAAYAAVPLLGLRRGLHRYFRPGAPDLILFLAAWALHTRFLVLRGGAIGHCPLTNGFEVLAFVAWSAGLTYLVIGPLYHLTLLGAVTAPLCAGFLAFALAFVPDVPSSLPPLGWALEFHAALSVIAYGALGIAALAGAALLVQHWCLKHKALDALFSQLPPLHDLAAVHRKLLLFGLILFTLGAGAGFFVPSAAQPAKLLWTACVWFAWLLLAFAALAQKLSLRRGALASIAVYAFMLGTFWLINFGASPTPHP